jgi:hypothetical protein
MLKSNKKICKKKDFLYSLFAFSTLEESSTYMSKIKIIRKKEIITHSRSILLLFLVSLL